MHVVVAAVVVVTAVTCPCFCCFLLLLLQLLCVYNRLGACAHVHVHVHVHVHDETSQVKSVWLKREDHVNVFVGVCNRSFAVSRLADYDRDTLVGGRRRYAFAHSQRSHCSRTYSAYIGCILMVCVLMVCAFARSDSFAISIASVDCEGRERRSRSLVEGFGRGRRPRSLC